MFAESDAKFLPALALQGSFLTSSPGTPPLVWGWVRPVRLLPEHRSTGQVVYP